jgi:hypothetical protein
VTGKLLGLIDGGIGVGELRSAVSDWFVRLEAGWLAELRYLRVVRLDRYLRSRRCSHS